MRCVVYVMFSDVMVCSLLCALFGLGVFVLVMLCGMLVRCIRSVLLWWCVFYGLSCNVEFVFVGVNSCRARVVCGALFVYVIVGCLLGGVFRS